MITNDAIRIFRARAKKEANRWTSHRIACADLFGEQIVFVRVDEIVPTEFFVHPYRVGFEFDRSVYVKDLPSVVKLHGMFYLVDGHHRIMAARHAGIYMVPVKVVDYDNLPEHDAETCPFC